jgi:hypothetical protein
MGYYRKQTLIEHQAKCDPPNGKRYRDDRKSIKYKEGEGSDDGDYTDPGSDNGGYKMKQITANADTDGDYTDPGSDEGDYTVSEDDEPIEKMEYTPKGSRTRPTKVPERYAVAIASGPLRKRKREEKPRSHKKKMVAIPRPSILDTAITAAGLVRPSWKRGPGRPKKKKSMASATVSRPPDDTSELEALALTGVASSRHAPPLFDYTARTTQCIPVYDDPPEEIVCEPTISSNNGQDGLDALEENGSNSANILEGMGLQRVGNSNNDIPESGEPLPAPPPIIDGQVVEKQKAIDDLLNQLKDFS